MNALEIYGEIGEIEKNFDNLNDSLEFDERINPPYEL